MRILMVEDDIDLCDVVVYSLKLNSYSVDVCYNGIDAMDYIKQNIYDLILLDRMLPQKDGLSILHHMRTAGNQTPVILVTAVNGIHDRIEGLDTGADDYLVKPYSVDELLARIRTILRRSKSMPASSLITYSNVTLDTQNHCVSANGLSCSLTVKEYELLEFFMKHPCQTLDRKQLYSRVWGGMSEVEDGNLDNYIYFLRKRLRTLKSSVTISAVYGRGFRMEDKSC